MKITAFVLLVSEIMHVPIIIIYLLSIISIVTSFSTTNCFTRQQISGTRLQGSLNKPPLELCDENIAIVMEEIRTELGTLFGYDAGMFCSVSVILII